MPPAGEAPVRGTGAALAKVKARTQFTGADAPDADETRALLARIGDDDQRPTRGRL